MKDSPMFLFWLCVMFTIQAQQPSVLGTVLDSRGKKPLKGVLVAIEGETSTVVTDTTGLFRLYTSASGKQILHLELTDYSIKRIPVVIESDSLNLNLIFLERDIRSEQADNLITLTDSELLDDEVSSISAGLLQATRDVFLSRAAFDFGQAFFRVRGYDSQYGQVLINGVSMNTFQDGRPQWNHWGGLNDVTRNQHFTQGLQPSEYNFGGILGNTNIDTRPSGLRPGTRFSSSFSNRTYAGRLMATHTSKAKTKGLFYSISASRRWAKQGYIDGTLYDAFSVYGALEYQLNTHNSFNFTGMWASNRRGRSSALTEEVFHLAGKQYNPYWGEQEGNIRNSRERKIAEPILLLNHFYTSKKFNLNTAIAYQFGVNKRSRLAYFNAPNPDPTYYRYLPSFYVNSPIGANFTSANTAREGLLTNPHLNWNRVYAANKERAAYLLQDDVIDTKKITLNTIGNMKLSPLLKLDIGAMYQQFSAENYASIADLLGAEVHLDIDVFSNTRNDINGELQKKEGDRFGYDYRTMAMKFETFAQLRYSKKRWDVFLATQYANSAYQRTGRAQNERFISNSLGKSEEVHFTDVGFKGGMTYRYNGRHSLMMNGAQISKAPVVQNSFINPRENNQLVPRLNSEKVTTFDVNYYLRLPKLTGRFTGFYSRFQDVTDVNFFFVDTGIGSDFVQEVITDLDKLHKGIEVGVEYQVSSTVKLSGVAAMARYNYASDPLVSINFDTAGAEEDRINQEGVVDLGRAQIKDYRLAQGPQQAYSFGVHYRDPKYWWVSATANYLTDNYANISTITRTSSFYLNPDTGEPFADATEENVARLLRQDPLDSFYLLNLVGGKSWLKKGKYISIFASINNLFDATFRTGGYEQSRNGNFGQLRSDSLSGTPSFAPKYWYGYGRTFFLNLAYSF